MFLNTTGTDTCLNQVSKKTPKIVKNNNKYYNIFEPFPEEITEKKSSVETEIQKMKEMKEKREYNYRCQKRISEWGEIKKYRLPGSEEFLGMP
jgi:deoxyribodipyrimidine photolyase